MTDHPPNNRSSSRPGGAGGERRRAIEREREILRETGQIPVVREPVAPPTAPPPRPNSRRARRLAEQASAGTVPAVPVITVNPHMSSSAAGVARSVGRGSPPAARPPAGPHERERTAPPDPGAEPESPAVNLLAPPLEPAPTLERPPVERAPAELAPSVESAPSPFIAVAPTPVVPPEPMPAPLADPAPLAEPEPLAEPVPLADPAPLAEPEAAPSPVPPAEAEPAVHRQPLPSAPPPDEPREELPGPPPSPPGGIRRAGRRLRSGWMVALGVVVAAAIAGTAALMLWPEPPQTPSETAPTAADQVQRTMLIVVEGGAGEVAGAALLGIREQSAVSVLIPGALIVDVPGQGRGELGAALAESEVAAEDAVSDAVRVRVDGSWVLSSAGLVELVDSVGGVVVDVDREIDADGVTVPAGEGQRLSGKGAGVFATTQFDDEPVDVQLARLQKVLTGLISALPENSGQIAASLAGVGGATSSTFTEGDLARALAAVQQAAQAGGITGRILPVNEISAGDVTAYGLDDDAAAELIEQELAGAQLAEPPGGAIRVLVQDATGQPELIDAARQRLRVASMRFVAGADAEPRAAASGISITRVLVAGEGETERRQGEQVATALGVPDAIIEPDPVGSSIADVVVLLGQDFADDVTDRGVLP